jgi:DNA-binding CsgD family transcriptional regulator
MEHVARADAQALLAFLGDAESLDGPEPFTTELLDRLGSTLASEFATYYTFDAADRVPRDYVACSLEAQYVASLPEEWRYVPIYAQAGLNGVGLWSDTLDRRARRRYESTSFARAFEVVDCAWTVIDTGERGGGVIALHRQERDFTERERGCVNVLRPHLGGLIRHARARRRLHDLVAAVDAAGNAEPQGVVLLGGGGRIEHASPAAARLLRSWFDDRHDRLPTPVDDWLRSGGRRQPLVIERRRRRLVVEAATRRSLVLTESTAPPACLTARELDVLERVGRGLSSAEAARELFVTPATVSKHLENVYRKLGVHNRTAALAASGALRRHSTQTAALPEAQ